MKKKNLVRVVAMCFIATVILSLTSCSGLFGGASNDIAFITDGSDVSESELMREIWSSVEKYARSANRSCDLYIPESRESGDVIDIMMKAIMKGSKLIICPGQMFEWPVFKLQDFFPDVSFLLLDGIPNDGGAPSGSGMELSGIGESEAQDTKTVKISTNVFCISFCEEQAGYLAGYMSVLNGYTHFGIIADRPAESYDRYSYGFLQGVNAAGIARGLPGIMSVKYWMSDEELEEQDIKRIATGWYISNTEIIFALGGARETVISVAENLNGRVICADTDGAMESHIVVTSAIKCMDKVVSEALESFFGNGAKWDRTHAGKSLRLGAERDGVGIPTGESSWRFGATPVEQYEEIYEKLVSGEILVSDSKNAIQGLIINFEAVSPDGENHS